MQFKMLFVINRLNAHAGNASQAYDGGSGQRPLDVLTSVAGQRKVILGLSQKQSGMFLNWNGERLDW